MTRLRILTLPTAIIALALALAACGGSDSGSSDVNPQKVLNQTFSGESSLDSADLDATMKLASNNLASADTQSGKFFATLSGPIESGGSGPPKFDLTLDLSGTVAESDFGFDAGLTSTGEKGFVSFQGTDYELDAQQYAQFTDALNGSSFSQTDQGTLPGLRDALTNVTNEGETEVDGTQTIHVSGDVDFSGVTDAIRSLTGGDGGAISQAQRQQLQAAVPGLDVWDKAIKEATFDVYSGVNDHLLRELDFTLVLEAPDGSTVDLDVAVKLRDVNQPQQVSAPANAVPLSSLISKLAPAFSRPPPAAGGSGGSGSTSPSTPGITPPSGADSALLDCLQQAKTAADLQACANK